MTSKALGLKLMIGILVAWAIIVITAITAIFWKAWH